jgi:hypothetical protein
MATTVSGTSSQAGQCCVDRSSIQPAYRPSSTAAPTLSSVISGITTIACSATKHASIT